MIRLSTLLQLQSVWDTNPSSSSLASSPTTLSRHSSSHNQPATLLTSAASLVLEDNIFSASPTPSLQEISSSVLPTPSASLRSASSIQAGDSEPPTNDSSNSDALYHAFEQVHPMTPTAVSHLQDETLEKSNLSSNITTTSSILPPFAFPPAVPTKDHTIHHHLPMIARRPSKSNKVSDQPSPQSTDTTDKLKKKEKRLSKYGLFGSRSSSPPPPLPTTPAVISSSMIPSPTPNSPPPLIDGAHKTLRRETSKFNLRRKSLSKKVKRAISNIKLNGTTNHPTPLPPTTLAN